MKKTTIVFLIVFLLIGFVSKAQYLYTGAIDDVQWEGQAYLSVVDDYRKISGVYPEQVINKVPIENAFFKFTGNNLEEGNHIYRIHVDNCPTLEQDANHFNGICNNSQEILFIANNKDTLSFPVSTEDQMFCSILSSNIKSTVFFRIDSLKEVMRYDYGTFRSEANRKLNNKKWFQRLQSFGEALDEPLAELYVYNFLSDRSGALYTHYTQDLLNNDYYDQLLERLKLRYPGSSYTAQYETELIADRYTYGNKGTASSEESTIFNWPYILLVLLLISALVNFFLYANLKKIKQGMQKATIDQLTQQEQKILDLILQEKTNKEIASEIFVSVSTVKTHINNLYKKLNIQSRTEVRGLFNK